MKTKQKGVIPWVLCMLIFLGIPLLGTQEYTLKAPAYTLQQGLDGSDSIRMEGYRSFETAGYPELPTRDYMMALPPNVDPKSVNLRYVVKKFQSLGSYDIDEVLPMMAWADGKKIVGEKADIYSQDEFFPRSIVQYTGFSQMRKWRVANFSYTPFQYNPVTRELRYISEVDVVIDYELKKNAAPIDSKELRDNVMDHRARQMITNYEQGSTWYTPPKTTDEPSVTYNYVIITTNAIESASTKLADFVTYLTTKGHSPLVITEDEFSGLTGQAPNGTAEKMRKWLQNNYIAYSIEYVLLIGNPHPTTGDIPMKMCWPRYDQSTYKESPTDYFYADLTGNWDLDGDEIYGEASQDLGVGGVDFSNEVYVGRIPVYSGVTNLDSILTKTIQYGTASDIAWRKNALLPMSFSTSTYDGAPLAEQMKDDYLTGASYSTWTQYQQGGGACALDSVHDSDEELRGGTVVRSRWAAGDYGLVVWWGHGSQTSASVGCDGCWDGTLFSSSYASYLDNNHPSFVYLNSCTNGYPENTTNLQFSVLKNGGIATVGASRVSWFNAGVDYGEFDGSTTNSGIGYEYAARLVQGLPASKALYDAKSSMNPGTSSTRVMNYYDFNLYGDPSIGLNTFEPPSVTVTSPNGGEAWTPGSTQDITWTSTGTVGNVKIEYSTNGGSNWTSITASTDNDGSHSWSPLPAVTSADCLIRVSETDDDPTDVSDAVFTIAAPAGITVTSPNGGETWSVGAQQDITWSTSGIVGNVRIDYSTAGAGGTYTPIVASTANDGTYSWTVPNVDSTQCVIKVSESDGSPADTSNGTFTIEPTPFITVTSPNGSECWRQGTAHNITWDSGSISGDVTVYLLKNGSQVLQIGTAAASSGTLQWNISAGRTPGTDYTVKVIQGGVFDTSDADFLVASSSHCTPDFNGDGDPDLLLRNYNHGSNQVWYMNGPTKTGSAAIASIANVNWRFQVTGDFNNDGKPDIVLRNFQYGTNQIWFMNGATRTGTVMLPTIPDLNWFIEAAGDFNNDGNPDLLLRNHLYGTNQVWYMNGATRTGAVMLPRIPDLNWQFDSVADFNNDGKPDILMRNYQYGTNQVWYMNGVIRTGSVMLPRIPDVLWHIDAAADFNYDGKPDLFLRHYENGNNQVWYMNGVTKIGSTMTTRIPDINWYVQN